MLLCSIAANWVLAHMTNCWKNLTIINENRSNMVWFWTNSLQFCCVVNSGNIYTHTNSSFLTSVLRDIITSVAIMQNKNDEACSNVNLCHDTISLSMEVPFNHSGLYFIWFKLYFKSLKRTIIKWYLETLSYWSKLIVWTPPYEIMDSLLYISIGFNLIHGLLYWNMTETCSWMNWFNDYF